MNLKCDVLAASRYSSQSQIARVLTEKWFGENAYCLACEGDQLIGTQANTKASDFLCTVCKQSYELKAYLRTPRRRLVDGAYSSMISRILSSSPPILMLLERDMHWRIINLTAVHNLFLTPEVIEKRKPLSKSARRAGWTGCSIRLDLIAPNGLIKVVHEAESVDRTLTRRAFGRFAKLKEISPRSRGWTTLTLQLVKSIGKNEFSLGDVYAGEGFVANIYPDNHNIRAKIRQQLQVLRGLGYLEFAGRGKYKIVP